MREQQIELEQWCRNIGATRALSEGWEKGAQGCIGNRVATLYLEQVRKLYEKSKNVPGKQSHIFRLMHSSAAVDHVALESLVFTLGAVGNEITFNKLSAQIGKRAEMVLWLTHPSWGQSKHLKGLKLAGGKSLDMKHMLARLKDKGFRKAALYKPLEPVERIALGGFFVEAIQMATKMIEISVVAGYRGRRKKVVHYSNLYWQFLDRWKQALTLFRPLKMPMMVPPLDWQGHSDGGYLTTKSNVSTVDWERWPEVSKRMHGCVLGSLNYLQSIEHEWDHFQVDFAHALWQHGHEMGSLPKRERLPAAKDKEFKDKGLGPSAFWKAVWKVRADRRKDGARSAFVHALIGYERLKTAETLHWVHHMDHRGRVYQHGGHLSVQGSDHYRSMFRFKEKSPVKGFEDEFAWSICDAYGIKGDERARVTYLKAMSLAFNRIGRDPVGNLDLVLEASDPFRFVQLCRDWHGYMADPGYTSGTIHWRDQCCSGWGHVACLVGDAALAQYTNVTGKRCVDLYMAIGRLIEAKLKSRLDEEEDDKRLLCLIWWHEHEKERSLYKKCLMPVIYGRSYLSLTEILEVYLRDELQDFLNEDGLRVIDLARVMASVIHETVKDCVPHVSDLAKWLTKVANLQIDAGFRPYWFTPNGMAVESYSGMSKKKHFELNLAGRKIQVQCSSPDGATVDKRKTARKLVPDYIHSQDAAFLQRFTYHWGKTYGHPLAVVHDCFGTTLDRVSTMQAELCDQWARFYSVNHLELHREMVQDVIGKAVPEPPLVGTLDRERVGENRYLFT